MPMRGVVALTVGDEVEKGPMGANPSLLLAPWSGLKVSGPNYGVGLAAKLRSLATETPLAHSGRIFPG